MCQHVFIHRDAEESWRARNRWTRAKTKEGPRRRSEEDAFPVEGNPKNPRASSRFSPSHQPLSWRQRIVNPRGQVNERGRSGRPGSRARKAYTIGQSVEPPAKVSRRRDCVVVPPRNDSRSQYLVIASEARQSRFHGFCRSLSHFSIGGYTHGGRRP